MATPRTINFYDSYTPSLTDGTYKVDIHQEVQKDRQSISHYNQNDDQFSTITQYFQVHVPRFSVDPSFVHASHPPNGARGQFDNELAHVSLNRLILPWEVLLKSGAEGTPWLALLIFAEGELPDDPHAQGLVNTSYTVNDLLTLNDPDVRGPQGIATDSVIPEVLQSTCRTIDVPSPVFTGVVPRFDELPYLTHVREVTDTPSLLAKSRMSLDELTDVGQYSVVVANRFPRTTGNYAAHLVSLEGFVDCLTPEGGPQVPGGQPTVRLVSLVSWSFSSQTEEGGHFSQRVHELALPGEAPNPDAPHALSLRLSPPSDANTDEAREVQRRLEWGYVPLSYLTAEGEETFAWYRGPLTPVPPPPLPPGLTPPALARTPQAHAAQDDVASPSTTDGLLVYVKDWGVFDLSYAVAWMTGWQLALSHAQARTAQKDFWRKARSTTATIYRRLTTPSAISGLDPEALTTAEALAHPHPVTHLLHTLVEGGLGQRLTRQRSQRSVPVVAASAGAPPSRAEQLRSLVQRSEVREMLAQALEDETAQVGDVLDSLGALDMIPFDHLVADQRMLPVESVRFFYTDSTWITALADGFASAGAQSDVDKTLHETVLARLRAEANTVSWPKAGLLLRSRLASDWPGMIIDAEKNNSPVQIVRKEYLAPDLLLCLFEDIPDVVTFGEPHQDLYFGAEVESDGLWLNLRHLTDNNTGGIIGDSDTFPAQGSDPKGLLNYLRTGSAGAGTLDIHRVVPDLSQALQQLGEVTGTLTPSDFSVEFIQSPSRQTFKQP